MRIDRIQLACLAILGTLAWGLADANAQQGSLVNSGTTQNPSTNFGQSTFGASTNVNTGGSINSPGSNMFSQPLPSPSFGSNSTSGSTTSSSGLGSSTSSSSGLGSSTGSTSAGANIMQQNTLNPFGAQSPAASTNGGNSSRNNSRFGAFSQLFSQQAFQNGFTQDQSPRLPTKLTVKFDHPVVSNSVVDAALTGRIQRIARFGAVIVSVEDRVATLTGTVASEDDLRLVDRFVAMEAGVSSVVNKVELQEPSPGDD